MAITLNGTTGISNDGGYTGDGISFADTTPSNTLVTTTGGNVGVGTSSPTERLTVANASTTAEIQIKGGSTAANYAQIGFYGGTTRNAEVSTNSAYLTLDHQNSGVINFRTGGSERMRIASNNPTLLIATTTGNANDGGMALYKNSDHARMDLSNISGASKGTVVFYYGATPTVVGQIVVNSGSTTYSTSSDYRLKENVAPMTGALATVAQLKPVTYTWKATGEDGQGFIAHELAEVVPDCVTGEKDAVEVVDIKDDQDNVIAQETRPKYQGIDTSFLVATLTAAIQEQTAIITDLKSRIEALEQA
jgi:hypothetical protein